MKSDVMVKYERFALFVYEKTTRIYLFISDFSFNFFMKVNAITVLNKVNPGYKPQFL
jgi:hypothetical protein